MGLICRTFVLLDMYNFNLLYKSLVIPHLEYGNIIWSSFLKSDINLLENTQRRATRFIPNINKLSYHERLEKLDLPTLSYRRFRGSMIETFKILHGYYDDNCVSSLFTFKDTITRGHKLSVRTWQCKTNIRRNFFTVQVNNLWNSLLGYVVESPSVNSLKNRLYKCVYVYMKYVSNVCVCKCLYIYYIYMYIYIYVCVCACMYRYIYTRIIFY